MNNARIALLVVVSSFLIMAVAGCTYHEHYYLGEGADLKVHENF